MAFRAPLQTLPTPIQERFDSEIKWYRDHLWEVRQILVAADEGLLSASEAQTRILAVVLRGLGEGPP